MISTTIFYMMMFAIIVFAAVMALKLVHARATNRSLLLELAGMSHTNPWKSQLMLMFKSGQHVPTGPSCTKTSMLYGALIVEETAETLVGLAKAIECVSYGKHSELYKVAVNYIHLSKVMQAASKSIRDQIATTSENPRPVPISLEVAKELLDGCTDLHVVTSGLSLACGLPGQAGYDRVATSNLSKANPVTGVIDKDASGKWIKGPNYHQPDLDSLLAPYYSVAGQ